MAGLRALLFPQPPRPRTDLLRALRIALRTLHILAMGILLGVLVAGVPHGQAQPWIHAAAVTGLLLTATFAWETCAWFAQAAGLVVLLKVAAVAALDPLWELRLPLLVGIAVVASVSSHMPGRLRHWVPPVLRR